MKEQQNENGDQHQLRADARATVEALRNAGIQRVVLASGDMNQIASAVGLSLNVDEILGSLSAEGKVDAVRREKAAGPVMMVGDGINDAPALAAADVGAA